MSVYHSFTAHPWEYEPSLLSLENFKNFQISEAIRKKITFIEKGAGLLALTGVITLIIIGVLAHFGVIHGASEVFINQKFIPFFHNLANTHIPIPPLWSLLTTSGAVMLLAVSTLGLYKLASHKQKSWAETKHLKALMKDEYEEYDNVQNPAVWISPPKISFLT